MRDLNYQLKKICRQCREGSYATQVNRERTLTLAANQLHDLGYRKLTDRSLKPKHVEALVKLWFDQGLSIGTLKNRMAVIRWWAHKVDKQNVVARSNEHYGIPDRRFITNESKAKSVTQSQLDKVRDEHVRMSLELQQVFGLRREEAMKFQPSFADQGDHIVLKASWTKGGRERVIPVRTETQRDVLNRARRLAGFGSLIPSNRNYVHQLRVYEGNTLRAGLSRMHGLRHAYAQNRYEELTGWKSPAVGGPETKVLTPEQREVDRQARLTISKELGHEREAVTAAYLGR
ncbi:MAG: integrase domain-containing protein [Candidatus Thiodiazotropha sp. (ex Troendleina suluensis)]|nr:integrase domain-containing protein [Candidatus Thiodiazotropha sp. (ex Troendleina suluensis)]